MLDILDAVIATAAVVLGLSLIVQAIQQIAKQVFDLKSSYMRAELLALFQDDNTLTDSSKRSFLNNFLPYRFITRKADTAAKLVVDQLEQRMSTFGVKDLHLLEDVDAGTLKSIISSISSSVEQVPGVQAKLDDAMRQIDLWLDICKKAFQEHYERRMKVWSFIISAVVVVALNANVFDIYKQFSNNKPVRETAIAMGGRFVSTPRDSLLATGTLDSTTIKKQLDAIQSILDEKSFQLMGWTDKNWDSFKEFNTATLLAFVGWLGMTLLVSLGAPFWYDFLKAVMGVKDKLSKGDTVPKQSNSPPANQVTGASSDIPPVG